MFVLYITNSEIGRDGFEELARLEEKHGALPVTWTLYEPSGNEQRWFRGSAPTSNHQVAPGLSIRGRARDDDDYYNHALLPPSSLSWGGPSLARINKTSAAPDTLEVAVAPQWFLELAEEAGAKQDARARAPLDLFGDAAITSEPALTREMLPAVVAPFAFDAAERLGVEPAMVALPALAICATCLDDKIVIQPQQNDTTWMESARLWFTVIAPPGSKKTPAMNAALRPLREIEGKWRKEDDVAWAKYERRLDDYKAARRGRSQTIKNMGAELAETDTAAQLGLPPVKPIKRRIEVGDATMEALAHILKDNPRGVLAVHDELVGWIASFDAYRSNGLGKDRTAALELWNGGARSIDRVRDGGSISVSNWSACVIGGIQPDKLREIAPKLDGDGFLQRFQPYYGRDLGRSVDRVPDHDAIKGFAELIREILSVTQASPAIVLSPEAQTHRKEVEEIAEAFIALPTTPAPLKAHLRKWGSMFARLLLTLHACEWVWLSELPSEVSPGTARMARDLMLRFFLPNALRFYNEFFRAHDQDGENARWIAGFVLADEREQVSARDIKRAYREVAGDDGALTRAMAVLQRAAWVGEAEERQKGSVVWTVNPLVHDDYADKGKAEKTRRDAEKVKIAEAAERVRKLKST
jgi:Protein of unknown function (DUF3987)